MTGHEAVAVRRNDGFLRWFGTCSCGWTQSGNSKEAAEALATGHMRDLVPAFADVLAQVRAIADRMYCDCWDADSLEFFPDGSCAKCRLLELCGAS